MKVLGTTRRGKVKITSEKQRKFLESHNIPYTYYKRKDGKIKKIRRNV